MAAGCCHDEAAIKGFLSELTEDEISADAPDCWENHKGRQCQDLEGLVPVTKATTTGLQLTIGSIVPPPSLLVPPVEVIDVTCGETREIKLYNNTCDNDSEVTFNGTWARIAWGILCPAGGTLSRSGTIPHYTGSKGALVHQKLQALTYTAPASAPSCLTKAMDVVRAEARGFTRDLLIRVSCGGPVGQAETPTLSPTGGTWIDFGDGIDVPVRVNAATSTPGATIRMTTDGSEPGPTSPARSSVDLPNNLTTTEQTIVKARAFADGFTPSGVAERVYSIKAAAPNYSPPGGYYLGPQDVAISSHTPGVQIRYTLDLTDPTMSSPLYTGPVRVPCRGQLKATAFKDRYVPSNPAWQEYICDVTPPSCNDLSGLFLALFTVESDSGGHAPFVNLQSATLTTSVNGSTLVVSGNHPSTVSASGSLNTSTCTGSATGTGTIAGFPGIRCDYENVTITGGALTGTYTCGVGGGLPGNLPIRYGFTGTRQGP